MELSSWLEAVAQRLDLSPGGLNDAEVSILLDLARDAAHEVERVAAPLTTFLAGVAVGRGADLADVALTVTNLLAEPGPQAEDSPG
nr:DUF6457 domain-containing protein [uncultured Friedmanniella sp.]